MLDFAIRTRQFSGDQRIGRSFSLAPDVERAAKKQHIAAIQSLAQKSVTEEDFNVRGMLLCNSRCDYYYSRFSLDALDEIAEMVPGAPVMTGHDYRTLPIGRFFSGKRVRIEEEGTPKRDQHWVEALYYVPKDAEGDAFVNRVDLGIWREVSIGFRLASAPCSVCKKAIWACEHIPGEVYEKSGICEWGMEGITSVLEGSQVFRGGQKDTMNFIPDGYGPVAGEKYRSALAPGEYDLDARSLIATKRLNLIDRTACGMTVDEWLASERGQRAMGWGALFGKRGERANTQSVICSKLRFSSRARAARWVRDHDWRADHAKETDAEFAFEQFDEKTAESGSFRSINLDEGVSARTCRIKQQQADEDEGRTREVESEPESIEAWLQRGAAS